MRRVPKLHVLRTGQARKSAQSTRHISNFPKLFPQEPLQPYTRSASTTSGSTDWVNWIKQAAHLRSGSREDGGKALLFAGLVSTLQLLFK